MLLPPEAVLLVDYPGFNLRLAKALHVSLDGLVFEEGEQGPDEDLRLRFEARSQLDSNERMVVKELLDGMLLKHQARRLAGAPV